MLKDSQLGKDLWGEAMATHIYIRNRCPSSILPGNITPYERIFGHPPSIAHLRVFGSKCYIKIADETRNKLDDKALECQLIGFEGDSIYVVVDSDKKRHRSRNAIFMEGKANRRDKDNTVAFPATSESIVRQQSEPVDSAHIEEVSTATDETRRRRTRSEVWEIDSIRRSDHLSNQEAGEKVFITKTTSNTPEMYTPKAYTDAVNSPKGKLWKEAMDYKLTKLKEMNTWSEVDRSDVPSGTQVLPGMWVHLIKILESGEKKFHSRWVVQGDKQKTNLSLSDTFAPISRISSLRILLALATLRDLRIFAWDVDSAYLNGKIDHDLYIDFPDGYSKSGMVGKLNKALYGFPKAARVWCEDFKDKLRTLRYEPLESDPGVFLRKSAKGIIAIDTHVDDGTGICSSEEEELDLKHGIQNFYKIKEKDTSKPFKVLGIRVMRDPHNGTLKLSQPEYIKSILQRFDMTNCNPVVTPVDKGSHLQDGKKTAFENEKQYQALTGSLTYAAMSTRPDIGYITQYLSQSNKNPSERDWLAAKRVLRYLKGTKDTGIVYRREATMEGSNFGHVTPWAFCDANYAEDPRDQRSTSGFVFMLANGPIAWKSKKQASVALSTTKAEYYALGIACQEAVWIKQLCQELLMTFGGPIDIYMDNTGAVALSDNPVFHNQSKHIDIRWHFVRDLVRSKVLRTSHIPGVQNGANFLMKALNHYEHEQCLCLLGME